MNTSEPAAARATRRRQRGFTLVELLVVLVILGLIATLAAPRVIKFIAGAKVDTAKVQIERLSSTLERRRCGSAIGSPSAGIPTWHAVDRRHAAAVRGSSSLATISSATIGW